MKKLTKNQIEFMREEFYCKLQDAANEKIDNDLIYYSDIQNELNRFTNIVEVLKGNYTMENLTEDLLSDYYNDEEFYNDFYNDYLDNEEKNQIDELEA